MDAFDLAVHGLAKIEDLFLRLIFENLGGTLVEVDLTQPGWERYLTLDRIMDSALHAFGSRQPPSKPGRPHWTFILASRRQSRRDGLLQIRTQGAGSLWGFAGVVQSMDRVPICGAQRVSRRRSFSG